MTKPTYSYKRPICQTGQTSNVHQTARANLLCATFALEKKTWFAWSVFFTSVRCFEVTLLRHFYFHNLFSSYGSFNVVIKSNTGASATTKWRQLLNIITTIVCLSICNLLMSYTGQFFSLKLCLGWQAFARFPLHRLHCRVFVSL